MPIEVDTGEAPALLRLRCVDPFPTVDEVAAIRAKLIAGGHINENSVSLIDVRDLSQPVSELAFLKAASVLLTGGWPRRT